MPGGGNLVRSPRYYRKNPRTPRSAHARYYYRRSLVIEPPRRPKTPTRCQSAPRMMDSTQSESASPREAARPQHRPPSPPPAGFENRGYHHDDADPNHNDSFTSNGPQQNGHSKEPNGVNKTEAVNLELINLTPKNGNTKKKDVEVDMNVSNPYDEYFVPVNEHRKYMRGEKLYVTQDKRGEKSSCKRPLCWTLGALVAAAVLALIVLAATGVIFGNSPTTLEQYNSSLSSARAFGGLGSSDHDHVHDHDHDHDHEAHDHTTSRPLNDEVDLGLEDTGDLSMYVPMTLEGEVKVDNEEFTPAMNDPESDEYHEFSTNFAEALKKALFDRDVLENGDNHVMVEVVKIRPGSVLVTYRIHWKPKSDAQYSDLMTANSLRTSLDQYLNKNSRMISVYHIAEDKVSTRNVLDVCQINKNDCEKGCVFDERTLDFMCTCPRGEIVDMHNPKKCMSLLSSDANEHKEDKPFKVLDISTDSMPSNPEPEPESEDKSQSHEHSTVFDWKETQHDSHESTSEPEPDLKFSHIFGHSETTPKPEHEHKPEPEPAAEPEPTSEPTSSQESKSKPEPESTSEPEPDHDTNDHKHVLGSESEPAAEPKAEPEPTAEPKSEPEPTAEPKAEPEPTAEPKSEPEPTAEPKPETESKAEPEPTSQSDGDNHNESSKNPVSISDIEPTSEPQTDSHHEHAVEPEPASEPEPTAEPEHTTEPESTETGHDSEHSNQKPLEETTITSFDHYSAHQTHLEMKPTSYNNELKHENEDSGNMEMPSESTTTKVTSISQSNVLQDSTKDIKPELIYILNERNRERNETHGTAFSPEDGFMEINTPTYSQNNMNTSNDTNSSQNDMDFMKENLNSGNIHDPQERSSHHANSEFEARVTTEKDDFVMGIFAENPTTTSSEIIENVTSQPAKEDDKTIDTPIEPTNNVTEQLNIPNMIEEARSMESNQSHPMQTTTEVTSSNKINTESESSLNNFQSDDDASKSLIDALSNNKNATDDVTTTTEKGLPDDISFDTINMLYNRSSKSIGEETPINETQKVEDQNKDITTTESDWLTEGVTEMNYENMINKMKPQTETTDATENKIDEIINRGLSKDDFEPDYLSNMGTKTTEPDVPMYPIIHDYDNEESRVKRVNSDGKNNHETTTHKVTNENEVKMNSEEISKETGHVRVVEEVTQSVAHDVHTDSSDMPMETTTVTDYIYKIAKKASTVKQSVDQDSDAQTTTSKSEPAPVWEESERDSVQNIEHQENSTNSVEVVPLVSVKSITMDKEETGSQNSDHLQEPMQNPTNLNVTIYEKPGGILNISTETIKPTGSHSGEYEEHGTNPFLPEAENNISLVRKLQEGHDLEPANLNETTEEHAVAPTGHMLNETDKQTNASKHNANTEDEASFNDLLSNNSSSHEIVTEMNKNESMVQKSKDKLLPISTFLTDTDDLDYNKLFTSTTENVIETSTNVPDMNQDPNESLSVVPIDSEERNEEKESLRKHYKSGNLLALNDISDSPKKSDRRTFESSKINSVSNNNLA